MDLEERFAFVDSEGIGKASASDSAVLVNDLLWKKTPLEPPAVPFSGESRFLTHLWVLASQEPWEELHLSDISISRITGFAPRAEKDSQSQKLKDKIRTVLKLLTFREQHVLVQFWSPLVVGKHRLLTTVDQPFGLGVVNERLYWYRGESKRNPLLVDKDHEEEDRGPPARVYRRGLPEWTCDITNYMPEGFTLQVCAIDCNLFGYLALPVFDSTTKICVGVLELLTSSKYMSYAYEVQQIHMALKTRNLTTPQVCDFSTSNVPSELRQNEMDKIFHILKLVCDKHGLPLAQTWAVSPFSSYVSHEKVLEKSCSSFNTWCIGKVCMSTTSLPYHVQDLGLWKFREACSDQHLEKSRGFVGRALLSRGSCFCGDVTKLSEEEYPLVHNAYMSGLTSCFAILLHNVKGDDDDDNDDYVLEFFLPSDSKDDRYIQNLVQTLKQNVEVASGFELGDISSIEFVGPPGELNNPSSNTEPHISQICSITTANPLILEISLSDSESVVANVAKTDAANVPSQSKQNDPNTEKLTRADVINDDVNVVGARKSDDATSYHNVSMQNTDDTFTDAGKKNRLKQGRKRTIDDLSVEAVEQHFGKPIGDAAMSLTANVPSQCLSKQNDPDTENLTGDNVRNDDVNVVGARKRDNATSYHNVSMQKTDDTLTDAGKKNRLKQGRKRKIDNLSMEAVTQHFGKPIAEAAKSLNVSRSTLKRFCREHDMSSWPLSKHNKRTYVTDLKRSEKPENTTNIVKPYMRVDWQLPYSSFGHASVKQSVASVMNMGMLTVKATYKEHMIKFPFPVSSGMLELENEVAKRTRSNGRRLLLKYKDEEDELVLIACDADLRNLLRFSVSNAATVKLIVQLADD